MSYIQLTELESTGLVSCKIKGLPQSELNSLQKDLTDLNITSIRQEVEDFFEADTYGVHLLNMLEKYYYRITGQSMVIEKSNIGGRTVQIQKIVWTLHK